MEKTANKPTFKEKMKEKGQKSKEYVNKKYQQAKAYGKSYLDDMRCAYDIGYAKGWDDAYEVPKRFCSRLVAAYGYQKGIKQHHKSDKYQKQYSRKGKKES